MQTPPSSYGIGPRLMRLFPYGRHPMGMAWKSVRSRVEYEVYHGLCSGSGFRHELRHPLSAIVPLYIFRMLPRSATG